MSGIDAITAANISTYIAAGCIGDAYIGNFIKSTNYNGTIDSSGNITANGTTGWAIGKGGKAVFQDIVARGDIQATSLSSATGTFVGSLSAATGSFAGSLSAATGTFAGTLTAAAVNAVNTVNIAGEAVTVPRAAFTAGSVTVATGGTVLQSRQITTHGQVVLVNFGCSVTAYASGGEGFDPATVVFGLYRDSTLIMTWSHSGVGNIATTASMPPYLDQPAAGTYTYYVKVYTAAPQGVASSRGMSLIECQR
jgi:hypothetical protein